MVYLTSEGVLSGTDVLGSACCGTVVQYPALQASSLFFLDFV
jgi:hypothetical protein